MKAIGLALLLALAVITTRALAAQPQIPYSHVPVPGDSVRLDGSLGGGKSAWTYSDQHWLEEYLKVTIDAAAVNKDYSEVTGQLDRISAHVTVVANGTKAAVEQIQPFTYNGHADVEVRVLVGEGPMRGRELWTTCGELVDSAGHRFVRL